MVSTACGGTAASGCGPGTTLSKSGVCEAVDSGTLPYVTCGRGTVADGSRCILALGAGGSPTTTPDGGGGATPPVEDTTPPTFAGAVRAETASDESILVSWN